MKLQHLAIIFVIIIVPISIVLSEYISFQTKTIKSQAEYDSILINSTYDALKAFELNTANNNYSTINNSKIRDIEASISTFYKSLATNFRTSGFAEDDLKEYTPAILFTLYDGYYIYSKYDDTQISGYKFGLKPLMYYSCRYKTNSDDFVVNYTLDNSITVIGKVGGQYVNKTGYLIDLDNIPDTSSEVVTENLMIVGDNNTYSVDEYEYITYNGQKIYKENGISLLTPERERYFYYSSEYKKDFINSTERIEYINQFFDGTHLYNNSARDYYNSAREFTQWANNKLDRITQKNAVDSQGNQITTFAVETGENEYIFKTSDTNNPLRADSTFNENRISVIRKSIETNLITAIQTFSDRSSTQYDFSMPELSETEWYNIENNIAMVTFMQGLSIGGKVYNNYSVVTNNTNEEMISAETLYVIDSNNEYHKPGCKKLIEELNNGTVTIKGMYSSTDFKRKSVSLTGSDANAHSQLTGSSAGDYGYYFRHSPTPHTAYTACYDCIVTIADTYDINDIISGNTITKPDGGSINFKSLNNSVNYMQKFLVSLARERYDIYITNGYLINE